MSNDKPAQQTLWDLIKDIRFGMLTHRSTSGVLHAHPLTTQNKAIDEHSELYFFLPKQGELYEQLQTDGQVNVSYADPGADSYVSLSGHARFSEDQAKKEQLWTPMAKAWFPDGVTDPNLALLVVKIDHAEYWDVDDSKMVQLFKMAKAAVTSQAPTGLGEHKALDLP
ncbi:general stress protein [Acidovorax sp. SRB_14]|uniref:pyridoxamine 5'-phosphate oxidase family protein n=1 Tax=Acidovorax sp. SRB_14 TaxID=1962699 RepID=UPI00156697E4|nr:pyridoxamine 5'-phosphate oxidase family protein [Acidovorax sp. SRB_14]NMM81666.1 general stress protein [Acidovorax sp. SRB_14]